MMTVLTERQALNPIFPKSKSPPKLQPYRLTLLLIMKTNKRHMFPDSRVLGHSKESRYLANVAKEREPSFSNL